MDGHIHITRHIGDLPGEGRGVLLFDIVSEVQSQPDASRFLVHINSPGGVAREADMISDYLDRLQQRIEVIAVGEGIIASAASKVFLTINKRAKGSDMMKVMIHNPWGGVEGDADFIAKYADEVRQIEKDYEKFYEKRLNIDQSTLSDLMEKETYIEGDKLSIFNIVNYQLEAQPQNVFALIKSVNEKPMTEQDKNWLQEQLESIKAFFKKDPVAAVAIMTNEGQELNFPTDVPAEGDTVQAPDGTYTFAWGDKNWIGVIENNTLISLTEVESAEPAADPEMEALKQENESLKKQIEEIQARQKESFEKMKSEVLALQKYVEEHKAIQSTEDPEPDPEKKFEQPEIDPIKARLEEVKAKRNPKNK